jgi:hypothetical protein
VHTDSAPAGAVPALLKGLFILVTALVVAAAGYAGWIVLRYWNQVGV